jgi:small membrane protein
MNFQYFLLILLATFFIFVLCIPRQTLLRKGSILCFVSVMLTFALKPDWSTELANYFGIVRGVDFLFYLSHLTLFFIAFVYYLKFKKMEIKFAKLVRRVAIESAIEIEQ